MEEMEILMDQLRELNNSISGRNINEVGVIELRRLRKDYEALHELNLDLQERVRFDRSKDTEEVRQTLILGDELWERVGEALKPILEVLRSKVALGYGKVKEVNRLKNEKERNLKLIETLRTQLDTVRTTTSLITDESAKRVHLEILETYEKNIKSLEELDKSYDEQINRLNEEISIIRLGGVLTELEDLEEDTKGISKEEAEEMTRGVRREAEEGIGGIDPIIKKTIPEESRDDTLAGEPTITDEVTREIPELPEIPDEEETENRGLPVFPSIPKEDTPTETGGLPEFPEDEEEEKTETSEEPGEPEDDTPTMTGGLPEFPEDEEEEETETPEEPGEPEEEEEETPVRATVRQPKSKLWQKLKPVIEAVKVFLLTAIAVHTGLAVGGMKKDVKVDTKTETVEESEIDIPTEETEPEAQTTEEPVLEKVEESAPAEVETQTEITPVSTTPVAAETPTVEPTATPEQKTEETGIEIGRGESVYNTETGVEVGFNGTAAYETPASVTPLENRTLEATDHDTVIVTEKDLQNDAPTVPATATPELGRTGQEITEEEAKETLTEGELKNLDEATSEVDWDSFFENTPTL